MGVKPVVILFKHILPNIKDIILTRGAPIGFSVMMTEASLSFRPWNLWGKSWGSVLHYAFFRNSILKINFGGIFRQLCVFAWQFLVFMLIGYYGRVERRGSGDFKPEKYFRKIPLPGIMSRQ